MEVCMLRSIRIALLLVGLFAPSFISIKDAGAQATGLVNGSFVNPPADWMLPGHPDQLYEALQTWYGFAPSTAGWSPSFLVFPPFYSDIWAGGPSMANILTGLRAGNLNVVTHSHGGNVAILSTYYMSRRLRTLVNLGTPINFDLPGHLGGAGSSWRCQVSSSADWVQFAGSSPYQIANFAYAIYASVAGALAAFDALAVGDYATALAFFQYSVFEAMIAEYWWYTTKIEVVGPTYMFSGLGHDDLHTRAVWNAVAPFCG
jgi:hypothetical protein